MSPLADSDMDWPVQSSEQVYDGALIAVRRDVLVDPAGGSFSREVVVDPGAVGIVAVDSAERVLVVTQYRHPARRRLVELPAGLLDNPGENPLDAAKRELAEEGLLAAGSWTKLLDLMPSPGITDETMTLFLAEEVSPADPPEGFVAEHEEVSMTRTWVPLADLVDAVLARRVVNMTLVAGVLAAWVRRHPPIS